MTDVKLMPSTRALVYNCQWKADQAKPHPRFWLEDGSLIIRFQEIFYKIHKTLLFSQSPTLEQWVHEGHTSFSDMDEDLLSQFAGCATLTIPEAIGLRNQDLEALLQHLYHDAPLSPQTPFSRVASVIRASSLKQLNFPRIFHLARKYMEDMFPSGPKPFSHPDCLEEALILATDFDIPIRKGILYSIVKTLNFDADDDPSKASNFVPITDPETVSIPFKPFDNHVLSSTDIHRCRCLMRSIMGHFTPVVFTLPSTPHKACTDVFANTWMSLVIEPALVNGGVYKPLETLQDIIEVDWTKHGLCASCVNEKRNEWWGEQQNIWEKMDGWADV